MVIVDLYSKRRRRERGEISDTYHYDAILPPLRRQLFYAIQDGLGDYESALQNTDVSNAYEFAVNTLRREYGVSSLAKYTQHDFKELEEFFMTVPSVENALDVLEICCRLIDRIARQSGYAYRSYPAKIADEALKEINGRLKENAVGYQYLSGEIIRVDSELIHAEIVKPTLILLNGKAYAGAQDEYLSAHEHYRHGNNKEALVDCLKAFESTMKAICDKRGWTRDPNATASALIKLLLEKELVPAFWQTHINALKSSLESAVPTGRNKLAGHGQGPQPIAVPNYLAGYMLHMTASTMLFLMQAEKELEP